MGLRKSVIPFLFFLLISLEGFLFPELGRKHLKGRNESCVVSYRITKYRRVDLQSRDNSLNMNTDWDLNYSDVQFKLFKKLRNGWISGAIMS